MAADCRRYGVGVMIWVKTGLISYTRMNMAAGCCRYGVGAVIWVKTGLISYTR